MSSYQAIARKWRPATFEEISGQGHVTRTLQNALRLERIHHAFLFTGARGVGKTTAARTLARALNCKEGPTPTPCGTCVSCTEIPAGNSSDVIEIDGASNNSVDDVRELRDAVRYLPSRDRFRVYIIDEVHMLSIGAFNALLKTLEEPPDHVVFIFATTEPQKIPDTILSRVQRFDFKRIPMPTVVARLQEIIESEQIEVPEAGLRLIARAGEGSMRDSQSLLDQVIAFGGNPVTTEQVAEILGLVDRGLLFSFLEGLVGGRPEQCLDSIAQVYDFGHEMSQFTSELLELLRNAALVSMSPSARKHLDVAEEEVERLEQAVRGIDAETLSRWFQVLLQVHDEVSRAPRPRLVLEMAVARLVVVRPLKPVDTLLARLEDLERRLRQGGARLPDRPVRSAPSAPAQSAPQAPPPAPRPPAPRPPAPQPPAPQPPAQPPAPRRAVPPPAPPPAGPPAATRPMTAPRLPVDDGPPQPPPWGEPVPQKAPVSQKVPVRTEPPPPPAQSPPPSRPEAPSRPSGGAGWAPPRQTTWGATSRGPRFQGTREAEQARREAPAAPKDDDDEGPSVPPQAGDEQRFQALWSWLPDLPRYRIVRENAAFGQREPNSLQLLCPDIAALTRARRHEKDPQLLRGLASLWPGCVRVEFVVRLERTEGETRRETRERRREEHRRALLDESRNDPFLKSVCESLGATITSVKPLQEPQ